MDKWFAGCVNLRTTLCSVCMVVSETVRDRTLIVLLALFRARRGCYPIVAGRTSEKQMTITLVR